jgi:phospholipase C
LVFTLGFIIILQGCSNIHTDGVSTPPTVVLSAAPSTITAGSSATLTVSATNAEQLTVSGSDGSNYTLPAVGGTQTVTPTATTTYTATAVGTGGKTTASATVTVQGTTSAATVSIAADPTTIAAGQSSTLTVAAANATAVTVTGSDGSSYTLPTTGGTQLVTPSATTTYTATAAGATGNVTATATVTVEGIVAPPTVSISANPTTITAGQSSTLTVAATNATTVTITGSDGSSYSLQPAGGTQQVTPTVTTTYTATATGASGNVTATATVTVGGTATPATVSISANPTTITAGQSSTLTVAATNATAVTVTGSDGSSYTLPTTGGTQQVTPATSTTYTATATGATGNVTATATVTVQGTTAPATVSITASPTTVTAGQTSTLTVTATNATAVKVTGSDGTSYTLPTTGGTQQVTPSATTTYTATATGATGNVTATATVTVQAASNTTVAISANPTTIAPGGSSTLTVSATNASAVQVTGSDGTSYTLSATGGTQQVSPGTSTTYTATATGAAGNVTATATVEVTPAVTIVANPNTIPMGSASTLQVTATNATQVTVTGTDGSSYTLPATGGSQSVSPTTNTTYTATATNAAGSATAQASVTVQPAGDITAVKHVVFMLQENHSFDNYFGMLNPYRKANHYNIGDDGKDYEVDGIDDKLSTISNQDDEGDVFNLFKLKSTCVDDMSSDWLASFGDVNRYDFSTTRPILMDGFVHDAEGFAKSCSANGAICSGSFNDLQGKRAMGYYDQDYLNYYYYMASQFAISDRWFSPVASKSVDNRIATFSGGTTQGLVKDPGNDNVGQLNIGTIFQELDQNNVSWKIYYTVTQGFCADPVNCSGASPYPATFFSNFVYANKYMYQNPSHAACVAPTQPSSVVGDSGNSFCIDPNHIAPIKQYYTDITNNTLPSFAFIEAGYANDDEHPGSGQSVLNGQAQSANVINSLMTSASWSSTVFFFSFDEGGGPYDHVPPVPGHSNDNTNPALGSIPDISMIAVNPDSYFPCVPSGGTPTTHCDLSANDPGAKSTDAPAQQGFAAQLGFRLPNMIISPFTRKHYVSHTPMDHTAVIKFVENRFINSSAHLTARDAAQSNLLEFFDFSKIPWITPPSPPTPVTDSGASCTPDSMGP